MTRAAFLLMPMLLTAAELTVDHVTIAGPDLKAVQAALARAGIATEYGGPHANHTTEMALVTFPDGSYLELIAPVSGGDVKAHPWRVHMEENAGPCAWAVRIKDIDAEVARLKAAGIAVAAPHASGRKRPDGTTLGWQTAQIGEEPNGTFFPFLIRDLTPRALRISTGGKPLKDFVGVSKVVIAVRSLADSVKRFRAAYGVAQPLKQVDAAFGAHLAMLGGTPVILAEPLHAQTWLAQRIEEFGEGPCAFLLAARKAGKYKVSGTARWFGADVSWLDTGAGHPILGFE